MFVIVKIKGYEPMVLQVIALYKEKKVVMGPFLLSHIHKTMYELKKGQRAYLDGATMASSLLS